MSDCYELNVAGVTRQLPIIPISPELAIASFVILGDCELVTAAAPLLAQKLPKVDYLVTAEAKGIPLVHEMARQSGARTYFIARKEVKTYMPDSVGVDVNSITTQHRQQLFLSGEDAAMMRGKRILLVDDVISTGESMRALETLVEKVGGTVAGRMSILAEGDAQNRGDIVYLEKLPLFNPDGTVKD